MQPWALFHGGTLVELNIELLSGRLDYTTAQMVGKVRVEGEALAALFVHAMISGFRTRSRGRGWPLGRRFVGWLSYPTATKADEAFKTFHAALQARGLGAEQTIREVTIPREWK